MRATRTLRWQAAWPDRRVNDSKDSACIYHEATEVARLPCPNIRLSGILSQGDQPEDEFLSVQPAHCFAVNLIPTASEARQEEAEQRRVVEPPSDSLVHALVCERGLPRIAVRSIVPKVAAEVVMHTSRRRVDLAIERLFCWLHRSG